MEGQWQGRYKGKPCGGRIRVDIDNLGSRYDIQAFIFPDDSRLPASGARFNSLDLNPITNQVIKTFPVDRDNLGPATWETMKRQYGDDVQHMATATVSTSAEGNTLSISIRADPSILISGSLSKVDVSLPSEIEAQEIHWEDFKAIVSGFPNEGLVFRGQEKPWRLQTSFHRLGRNVTQRFMDDLNKVHSKLSALTPHYFNLESTTETGAFINLLQHHGYPTPLLDWTYSPFVAAFFAFSNINPRTITEDQKARIYVFEAAEWEKDFEQNWIVDTANYHLSIKETVSISNPRTGPQQALVTLTNAIDIESLILELGKQKGKSYIKAFDIKATLRPLVISDLRFMGITSGSLFPGLDGLCAELKERHFL